MKKTADYFWCAHCNRPITIRRDGTFYRHNYWGYTDRGRVLVDVCQGSGKKDYSQNF